jgi:hypothetical protein
MDTSGRELGGRQLGPYLLEDAVGAGAFGAVYRARHVHLGVLRAVKVDPNFPGVTLWKPEAGSRYIVVELLYENTGADVLISDPDQWGLTDSGGAPDSGPGRRRTSFDCPSTSGR